MIALIDTGLCNLMSVQETFKRLNHPVVVLKEPSKLDHSQAIILPGVGAFGDAMTHLKKNKWIEPLRKNVLEDKKPLLGICLGMQLLADQSEEYGLHEGLSLIPGRVVPLKPTSKETLPHMGWTDVDVRRSSRRFAAPDTFYFAHSFYFDCEDDDHLVGTFQYGDSSFAAIVEKDNILGVQFHPEKSQAAGLGLLKRFVEQVSL